ncbi:MAG: MGMT family protein [Bacteroidia bacterium]|nr:MGMT family protein [Bacteroidia bacterium]NNJ54793.1 MGMT family protein [Bacteroidia bacterium]
MPKELNNSFFDMVHQVVRLIPKGKVTSYGAIATYLGSAKSARMVGWALNKSSHVKPVIPAHRVVNKNGLLTGKVHFVKFSSMASLLESEGIRIENNCVVDLKEHFWNPNDELNLET